MKKILFLDIDGVLNYNTFCYSWKRKLFKKLGFNIKAKKDEEMISKYSLLLISILCKIKKYDVVLSSSWRFGWDENGNPINKTIINTDKLFKRFGLNIIGTTPLGKCELNKEYLIHYYSKYTDKSKQEYWRGTQILKYIEMNNLDINKCIIIDDDTIDIDCYDCLKSRFINTSFYDKFGGFRLKHLFKALKLED